MSNIKEIFHYISPLDFIEAESIEYMPTQLGKHIQILNEHNYDFENIDIVLIGCGELRGQNEALNFSNGPYEIRKELYKLHYWHPDVKIADLGNIVQGATLNDTKAALKTVLTELHQIGKKVLILGGSHDLTLSQYDVFKDREEIIDFTIIDMLADLDDSSENRYDSYLMEALTSSPNFVRHFNLVGFQSYFVNPNLIETFDKLCFDCIRLGKAREDIEMLEPIMRSTQIASVDINSIRYSDAPANKFASPNGFYGDEMCMITRFAGMSSCLSSFGIYGYIPENDTENITAKLIAQMIWYYIDGVSIEKNESPLSEKDQFIEYQITFTDNNTLFLKSKKTNRWWMKLPSDSFIPCSQKDYFTACNNEIPERWMREVERLV